MLQNVSHSDDLYFLLLREGIMYWGHLVLIRSSFESIAFGRNNSDGNSCLSIDNVIGMCIWR